MNRAKTLPKLTLQETLPSSQDKQSASSKVADRCHSETLPRVSISSRVYYSTPSEDGNRLPNLKEVESWDFDIFQFDCYDTQVLLLTQMFQEIGILLPLSIDIEFLSEFLSDVRFAYDNGACTSDEFIVSRPYHTFSHAFDVTQTVYVMLMKMDGRRWLEHYDVAALMFAAIGHDIGHPGFTNEFLLKSKHPLTMSYDQSAILEHMHANVMQTLIKKYNLLGALSEEIRADLLKNLVMCILGTDMNQHASIRSSAQGMLHSIQIHQDPTREKLAAKQKQIFLPFLLHCADLSNQTKPWAIASTWATLLMTEFFEQGQLEKDRGMVVSQSCDAFTTNVSDLQIKFIKLVVYPTFEIVQKVLPKVEVALKHCEENIELWEQHKAQSLTMEQRGVLRDLARSHRGKHGALRRNDLFSRNSLNGISSHPTLPLHFHTKFSKLLRNPFWVCGTTLLSLYILFGDDVRLYYFRKADDENFAVLSVVAVILYALEIVCTWIGDESYGGRDLYFWLDLLALGSLFIETYPTLSETTLSSELKVLEAGKSLRISRAVRNSRVFRAKNLVSSVQHVFRRNNGHEPLPKQEVETTFSSDQLTSIFDQLKNTSTNLFSKHSCDKLVHIAYNGLSPPEDAGANLYYVLTKTRTKGRKTTDLTQALFRKNMMEATAHSNSVSIRAGQGSDHGRSLVGQKLSNLMTRRLVILVLSLLVFVPILTDQGFNYNEAQDFGLTRLHGYARNVWQLPGNQESALEDEIVEFALHGKLIYFNLTTPAPGIGMSSVKDILSNNSIDDKLPSDRAAEEEFRRNEFDRVSVFGCDLQDFLIESPISNTSGSSSRDCYSVAYFSKVDYVKDEAFNNILLTLATTIVLVIGALLFTRDTHRMVIAPIERVVSIVEQLAVNPLARVILPQKSRKSNEIQLLEDTFVKIASLIQIGFGQAGAAIIATNMPAGDYNPMVPGRKCHAVFGFCDIRRFTDTTECLGAEVMVFTNIIGRIVHEAVHSSGGSANKNVGDAFLLVWKIPDTSMDVAKIHAARPPNHMKAAPRQSHIFEVVKHVEEFEDPANLTIRMRTKQKTMQEQMLSVADRALMAFLKIELELIKSSALEEYRYNQNFVKRFELPYIVKMGYGLHAGWAIEGAIGSKYKIDASYLSPDVNMAGSLEELTKEIRAPLLMSHSFYNLLSSVAQKLCRCLDCVIVPGTERAVSLYTFDITNRSLSDVTSLEDLRQLQEGLEVEFRKNFDAGVGAYFQGKWELASDKLAEALVIRPQDGPSQALTSVLMSQKCQCPSGWNGCRTL